MGFEHSLRKLSMRGSAVLADPASGAGGARQSVSAILARSRFSSYDEEEEEDQEQDSQNDEDQDQPARPSVGGGRMSSQRGSFAIGFGGSGSEDDGEEQSSSQEHANARSSAVVTRLGGSLAIGGSMGLAGRRGSQRIGEDDDSQQSRPSALVPRLGGSMAIEMGAALQGRTSLGLAGRRGSQRIGEQDDDSEQSRPSAVMPRLGGSMAMEMGAALRDRTSLGLAGRRGSQRIGEQDDDYEQSRPSAVVPRLGGSMAFQDRTSLSLAGRRGSQRIGEEQGDDSQQVDRPSAVVPRLGGSVAIGGASSGAASTSGDGDRRFSFALGRTSVTDKRDSQRIGEDDGEGVAMVMPKSSISSIKHPSATMMRVSASASPSPVTLVNKSNASIPVTLSASGGKVAAIGAERASSGAFLQRSASQRGGSQRIGEDESSDDGPASPGTTNRVSRTSKPAASSGRPSTTALAAHSHYLKSPLPPQLQPGRSPSAAGLSANRLPSTTSAGRTSAAAAENETPAAYPAARGSTTANLPYPASAETRTSTTANLPYPASAETRTSTTANLPYPASAETRTSTTANLPYPASAETRASTTANLPYPASAEDRTTAPVEVELPYRPASGGSVVALPRPSSSIVEQGPPRTSSTADGGQQAEVKATAMKQASEYEGDYGPVEELVADRYGTGSSAVEREMETESKPGLPPLPPTKAKGARPAVATASSIPAHDESTPRRETGSVAFRERGSVDFSGRDSQRIGEDDGEGAALSRGGTEFAPAPRAVPRTRQSRMEDRLFAADEDASAAPAGDENGGADEDEKIEAAFLAGEAESGLESQGINIPIVAPAGGSDEGTEEKRSTVLTDKDDAALKELESELHDHMVPLADDEDNTAAVAGPLDGTRSDVGDGDGKPVTLTQKELQAMLNRASESAIAKHVEEQGTAGAVVNVKPKRASLYERDYGPVEDFVEDSYGEETKRNTGESEPRLSERNSTSSRGTPSHARDLLLQARARRVSSTTGQLAASGVGSDDGAKKGAADPLKKRLSGEVAETTDAAAQVREHDESSLEVAKSSAVMKQSRSSHRAPDDAASLSPEKHARTSSAREPASTGVSRAELPQQEDTAGTSSFAPAEAKKKKSAAELLATPTATANRRTASYRSSSVGGTRPSIPYAADEMNSFAPPTVQQIEQYLEADKSHVDQLKKLRRDVAEREKQFSKTSKQLLRQAQSNEKSFTHRNKHSYARNKELLRNRQKLLCVDFDECLSSASVTEEKVFGKTREGRGSSGQLEDLLGGPFRVQYLRESLIALRQTFVVVALSANTTATVETVLRKCHLGSAAVSDLRSRAGSGLISSPQHNCCFDDIIGGDKPPFSMNKGTRMKSLADRYDVIDFPNSILIDDQEHNCDEAEKHGFFAMQTRSAELGDSLRLLAVSEFESLAHFSEFVADKVKPLSFSQVAGYFFGKMKASVGAAGAQQFFGSFGPGRMLDEDGGGNMLMGEQVLPLMLLDEEDKQAVDASPLLAFASAKMLEKIRQQAAVVNSSSTAAVDGSGSNSSTHLQPNANKVVLKNVNVYPVKVGRSSSRSPRSNARRPAVGTTRDFLPCSSQNEWLPKRWDSFPLASSDVGAGASQGADASLLAPAVAQLSPAAKVHKKEQDLADEEQLEAETERLMEDPQTRGLSSDAEWLLRPARDTQGNERVRKKDQRLHEHHRRRAEAASGGKAAVQLLAELLRLEHTQEDAFGRGGSADDATLEKDVFRAVFLQGLTHLAEQTGVVEKAGFREVATEGASRSRSREIAGGPARSLGTRSGKKKRKEEGKPAMGGADAAMMSPSGAINAIAIAPGVGVEEADEPEATSAVPSAAEFVQAVPKSSVVSRSTDLPGDVSPSQEAKATGPRAMTRVVGSLEDAPKKVARKKKSAVKAKPKPPTRPSSRVRATAPAEPSGAADERGRALRASVEDLSVDEEELSVPARRSRTSAATKQQTQSGSSNLRSAAKAAAADRKRKQKLEALRHTVEVLGVAAAEGGNSLATNRNVGSLSSSTATANLHPITEEDSDEEEDLKL